MLHTLQKPINCVISDMNSSHEDTGVMGQISSLQQNIDRSIYTDEAPIILVRIGLDTSFNNFRYSCNFLSCHPITSSSSSSSSSRSNVNPITMANKCLLRFGMSPCPLRHWNVAMAFPDIICIKSVVGVLGTSEWYSISSARYMWLTFRFRNPFRESDESGIL